MENRELPPGNNSSDFRNKESSDRDNFPEVSPNPEVRDNLVLLRVARSLGYPAKAVLKAISKQNWDSLDAVTPKEKIPKALDIEAIGHLDVLELLTGEKIDQDSKVWAILTGGGQAGVISAGLMVGMGEANLMNIFEGVIGVSAGVCNMMGYYGLNPRQTAEIYTKVNTQGKNFYKAPSGKKALMGFVKRVLKSKGGSEDALVDTTIIKKEMEGPRPIDKDAILNSRVKLVALGMDDEGNAVYEPASVSAYEGKVEDDKITSDDLNDPLVLMDGCAVIPGLDVIPSVVLPKGANKGKAIMDGAFSKDVLPIEEAFRRGATHVVVFSNDPYLELAGSIGASVNTSKTELVALGIAYAARNKYNYSDPVRQSMWRNGKDITAANRHLKHIIEEDNPQRRVLVLAPKNPIDHLEVRESVLGPALEEAIRFGKGFVEYARNLERVRLAKVA